MDNTNTPINTNTPTPTNANTPTPTNANQIKNIVNTLNDIFNDIMGEDDTTKRAQLRDTYNILVQDLKFLRSSYY
jgi:hypothetical protein